MADLLNALSLSHAMTIIVHGVSLGYAIHFMDKVPDSEKYTLSKITQFTTPVVDGTDLISAKPEPYKDGMFYMMNPMILILIMNIIVLATMAIHLFRRGFNVASMAYKNPIMQFLHIAAYGISHFIAIFLIALIAGVRDEITMVLIFVSILSLEGLQHLSANPADPQLGKLDSTSRGLIGFFAGSPVLVGVIFIGDALIKQDVQLSGLAFASLLVLEACKFLTESAAFLLQQLPFIGAIYDQFIDTRIAHSVYDALLKVFVVWFILLEKLEKSGGIDGEKDLTTAGSAAIGWSGVGIFAVYLLYSLLAPMVDWLPNLAAPGVTKDDFPAGTMEEKSRMLQVA